jgi:hypothetical protein
MDPAQQICSSVKLQKILEELGGTERRMIKLEGKFAPLYLYIGFTPNSIMKLQYTMTFLIDYV